MAITFNLRFLERVEKEISRGTFCLRRRSIKSFISELSTLMRDPPGSFGYRLTIEFTRARVNTKGEMKNLQARDYLLG